jgi:type VI secretion system secreted protein VgrG
MSIGATQVNRPLKLLTPSLGADVLLITGFTGHEAISELFDFRVTAVAENTKSVSFDKLIGQGVAIELSLPKGKKRYFHGIVKKVTQGLRDERFTQYRLEIVPSIWVLTRRYQSRIFQHITVMDILKKVFTGFDVASQVNMAGLHPRRFTAQYRETDFAFASRLMEEEGIFYYFKHTDKGDQMILANTPQAHPDVPDPAKITYGTTKGAAPTEYRIEDWEKSQELRSGKYSLWDHHFEMPQKTLEAEKAILETAQVGKVTHKLKIANNDKLEIYDYPGAYSQRFDGIDKTGSAKPDDLKKLFEDNTRTVGIRMQEEAAHSIRIRGLSNCGNFTSGYKLTLDKHFDGDGPYVLVSVDHQATLSSGYTSGGGGGDGLEYRNQFSCIPLALPFRPERVTPRPCVAGTQTAMVVGPKGEQIFCDKYGRVKVQFNWDRVGNEDPDSSCWLRVSQSRGGGKYGGMTIPHVGQEVIVSFEEGDIDRPIVTGCVFNADNMPPLSLPGHKTKTIQRDHGGNQIIMEGAAGKECIVMTSPNGGCSFSLGYNAPSTAPIGGLTPDQFKALIDDFNKGADAKSQIAAQNRDAAAAKAAGADPSRLDPKALLPFTSPGPNFALFTQGEWNSQINGKASSVTGDDSFSVYLAKNHTLDVGHVYTECWNNNDTLVKGNYTCRVNGYQEYSTKGDYTTNVFGKNYVTIVGQDHNKYLSLQTQINVGIRISAMLAASYIRAYGIKVEHDHTKKLNVTALKQHIAGKLQEKWGNHQIKAAEEKKRVGGLLKAEAQNMESQAHVYNAKYKAKYLLDAKNIKEKGEKLEIDAGKQKLKGEVNVTNGTMKINNNAKILE